MNFWKLATKNLRRNRRRNLATAIAVALGYAGLVLITGYAVRVEHYIRTSTVYLNQLGHVALYKEGGLELVDLKPKAHSLTVEDQAAIAEVLAHDPDVELWGRSLSGTGLAGNGCKTVPFIARGVELDVDRKLREHPEVRRWAPELAAPLHGQNLFAASAELGGVGPVLLAEGLARRLGKTRVHADFAGAPAPEFKPVECAGGAPKEADANVQLAGASFDGSFNAVDGEVMGVYSTGQSGSDESAVLTSLATLQSLYGTDKVTQVSVFLKDHRRAHEVAARIEAALDAKGVKVDAFAYDDEGANPYYVGTVQMVRAIAGFMTLIVMIVVVLSVLNSMTMTILERTREIGTFRSIGFTRRQVVTLLVREGLVLTAVAIVVGLVIGVGVALGVSSAGIYFNPPGVPRPIQLILTPSPAVCAALAAGMLVLCVVATWFATRRRVAMNIVELNTAVAA